MQQNKNIKDAQNLISEADRVIGQNQKLGFYLKKYGVNQLFEEIKKTGGNNELQQFLQSQLSEIQQLKNSVQLSEMNDQGEVKEAILKIFLTFDNQMRQGEIDKKLAANFLMASRFIETLKQFGPLPQDLEEKRLYAKNQASKVLKLTKDPQQLEQFKQQMQQQNLQQGMQQFTVQGQQQQPQQQQPQQQQANSFSMNNNPSYQPNTFQPSNQNQVNQSNMNNQFNLLNSEIGGSNQANNNNSQQFNPQNQPKNYPQNQYQNNPPNIPQNYPGFSQVQNQPINQMPSSNPFATIQNQFFGEEQPKSYNQYQESFNQENLKQQLKESVYAHNTLHNFNEQKEIPATPQQLNQKFLNTTNEQNKYMNLPETDMQNKLQIEGNLSQKQLCLKLIEYAVSEMDFERYSQALKNLIQAQMNINNI